MCIASKTEIELVVARYNEPLNWLRRVPAAIRVLVYDKNDAVEKTGATAAQGKGVVETKFLPNIGREAHTYLWHIVQNYAMLAPHTVFCQGRPFDHAFDFHRTLRDLVQNAPDQMDNFAGCGFCPLGHIIDTDDAQGARLFMRWSKNEDGRFLDAAGFYRALFEAEGPSEYSFRLGAQFIASASCIRRRPRSFYERALQLSEEFPDAAHCFERMWSHVFNVENPDTALLNGHETAYLKPMRRLSEPQHGEASLTT
ncbi:MAG TPA: DUF3431 domain-containing protein [Abditibacteriaceae bacterium]|jgi:hypothetical protein